MWDPSITASLALDDRGKLYSGSRDGGIRVWSATDNTRTSANTLMSTDDTLRILTHLAGRKKKGRIVFFFFDCSTDIHAHDSKEVEACQCGPKEALHLIRPLLVVFFYELLEY